MKSKPPLRKKRVPQVVAAKYRQNATLYWIDNLGPVNELYRVKGEWINSLYDTANPKVLEYFTGSSRKCPWR